MRVQRRPAKKPLNARRRNKTAITIIIITITITTIRYPRYRPRKCRSLTDSVKLFGRDFADAGVGPGDDGDFPVQPGFTRALAAEHGDRMRSNGWRKNGSQRYPKRRFGFLSVDKQRRGGRPRSEGNDLCCATAVNVP